ncbi:MAG: nif-specific transcriptional activator NifA [Rhodospirillaceae bacterium]
MNGTIAANSTTLSLISLYEISKMLSSSLDLERTLLDILNLLASYLQMRRGTIAVKGDDGKLAVIAAAGLSTEAVRKGAAKLPMGIARSTLASAMPYVVQNVTAEPALAGHAALYTLAEGERVSLIAVPLKTVGKPFGVLMIDRIWGAGDRINFESDVRLLVMVANLIGQTLKLHDHIAKDRKLLMDASCRRQEAARAAIPAGSGRRCQMQEMTGGSRPMRELYAQVGQVAPTRSTVMIRGESGTGKELIARAIHTLSKVKDGPFIRVNCAALPEGLLESELFGHEKGAFTGATQDRKGRFELAHNGTLFLDEIGEISLPFQAKLLRVLQEGEFERVGGAKTVKVKVRLLCATNRNLEEAVAQGRFRGDLYYRINVVPIFVPSLRDRREDIPLLADAFLKRFNEENERSLAFAAGAMHILTTCKFPGNVRELENCVNRAATMTRGDLIEEADLACQTGHCLSRVLWVPSMATPMAADLARAVAPEAPPLPPVPLSRPASPPEPDSGFDGFDDEFDEDADDLSTGLALPQRQRLIRAMEKAGWVQAKAARLLDLTPRQLGYALRKYNIEIKRL